MINNYVRKFFGVMFQSQQAQQVVRAPLHLLPTSPEEWCTYWQLQWQPWRTGPEIDLQRQEELTKRRTIVPDWEKGIYPFSGMKLTRADIEWLLATHENGYGPVDWSDESQRKREGLDLRGADLREVNLSGLPLARMVGGLDRTGNHAIRSELGKKAGVVLDGANLRHVHLEGAILYDASVRGVVFQDAFLQEARARWANIERSRIRRSAARLPERRRSHRCRSRR